jgi:hypothetical protein
MVTSYTLGGNPETVYVPDPLVVVERLAPVAVLVTEIVAPVTKAPDGSVTVPMIVPVSVCEKAGSETKASKARTAANRVKARMMRFLLVQQPRVDTTALREEKVSLVNNYEIYE